MRTREEIEAVGREKSSTVNLAIAKYAQLQLEVLLDIREKLYEEVKPEGLDIEYGSDALPHKHNINL